MKLYILKYFFSFFFLLLIISCNKSKKVSNDLINESSPYLLKHAYNPVNWKAWNNKTLDLAKKQNKLMIISIGYSSCHWCHVMEEESFENDTIAKLMNDNFINIKVDREERPDIDKVYINAVEMMTGKAGWPLNCITLPDGKPVFGGTYFTKEEWEKVLINVTQLYKENPQKVIDYANNITTGMNNFELIEYNSKSLKHKKENISSYINLWKKNFDTINGGLKGTPKFINPTSLEFLLRYAYQFNDKEVANHVEVTLKNIAFGGIYDQLGGGFSRYSVDDKWRIPHFEKMLYDNAQLVSLYAKAYKLTKNKLYKNVITETLTFIKNELTSDEGAFYSSLDADSGNSLNEKEEGSFYIWNKNELKSILGKDFDLFADYYNINESNVWDNDKFILFKSQSIKEFCLNNKLIEKDFTNKLESIKLLLNNYRNKRNKPNRDDKILTSWNALMIQGYIDAYKAIGDQDYLDIALKNARFIIENQLKKDGSFYRTFKDGKSTINAYLEDYATVINSFVSLYEVTFDITWLETANNLMDYTFQHFYDEKNRMFHFKSKYDQQLIVKKYEIIDGVIPSSNSLISNCLYKLGHYYYNKKYINTSEFMLNNVVDRLELNPSYYSNWINLMMNLTNPFYEIVIAGRDIQTIHRNINNKYLPNKIIAGISNEENTINLSSNKFIEDETLIYVCVDGTCKLPTNSLDKALTSLDK